MGRKQIPTQLDDVEEHLAVHQFIRLFGRRPTEAELAKYRRAQARVRTRVPAKLRRDAARLITRL